MKLKVIVLRDENVLFPIKSTRCSVCCSRVSAFVRFCTMCGK